MKGVFAPVQQGVEGGHIGGSLLEQGEGGSGGVLSKFDKSESKRIPGMPAISAFFLGLRESWMQLGKETVNQKFWEIVESTAANAAQKDLASLRDWALSDDDSVSEKCRSCDNSQRFLHRTIASHDAENGVCWAVFLRQPQDQAVHKGVLLFFGEVTQLYGAKAREARGISHFFWCFSDRSDAKPVQYNRSAPAWGENKAKHAATKTTARQRKLRSHMRRKSPDPQPWLSSGDARSTLSSPPKT
jgi:hypothetical protein